MRYPLSEKEQLDLTLILVRYHHLLVLNVGQYA